MRLPTTNIISKLRSAVWFHLQNKLFHYRLSAFVIKCFHEANSFISVDDSKTAVTLNWLLSGQRTDGSFFEPPQGRVIHVDMQVKTAGISQYCRLCFISDIVALKVFNGLLKAYESIMLRFMDIANCSSIPDASNLTALS